LFCMSAVSILLVTYEKTPASEAAAYIPFGDDYINFHIAEYPAKALQPSSFSLHAIDDPLLLQGATVTIELEMLNMLCGIIKFTASESSDGLFEGEGIPLMPGIWKATATIHWEDGSISKQNEQITRQFKVVAAKAN